MKINSNVSFLIEDSAFPGVLKIADKVCTDIERVTGKAPAKIKNVQDAKDGLIIFGTVGKSPMLDQLAADGKIHVTLTNLSCSEDYDIEGFFAETDIKSVKADILTEEMHAHNTFDAPETVKTASFAGIKATGNKLSFKMPKCSVMHIEVTV